MADYIPFVNGPVDFQTVCQIYDSAPGHRVSLDRLGSGIDSSSLRGLWIDPACDGYHRLLMNKKVRPDWNDYRKGFPHSEVLARGEFIKKPCSAKLSAFVFAVLDKCAEYRPSWISVPQLPVVIGSGRNGVNRALAKAAAAWRLRRGFRGKFVLPIIFSHSSQLKGKSQWGPVLRLARSCADLSGAGSVWAVDSTLNDQAGTSTLPARLRSLLEFHKEMRQLFASEKILAGPYWGLNLVLWARQLIDHPCISLGTTYSYHISGGIFSHPNVRIAIPPLRRWAVAVPELRGWLSSATRKLPKGDPAAKELSMIHSRYDLLSAPSNARRQVATFYRSWIDQIDGAPVGGRSLFLYQDLSSAFVVGKRLGELPHSEKSGRYAHLVAERLMLLCL